MTIRARIPLSWAPERSYTLRVLIERILGLALEIVTEARGDTQLEIDGRPFARIADAFFGTRPAGRLGPDDLPPHVGLLSTPYASVPLAVLYGEAKMSAEAPYRIEADLVASAFFLLTRWEEALPGAADEHGRFLASRSVCGKQGLLDRPLVNEWAFFIRALAVAAGHALPEAPDRFEVLPTHDVDLFRTPTRLKNFAADILKRRDIGALVKRAQIRGGAPDPYDTFGTLMRLSEAAGARSRFFFMAGGKTRHDPQTYAIDEPVVTSRLQEITARGHVVGFHPSYATFEDAALWRDERSRLARAAGVAIGEGRQHFLRFAVPATWRRWNDEGMQADWSMTFADQSGFRCGTATSYPVFDIEKRTQLALIEQPTVIMEGTLYEYEGLPPAQVAERLQKLRETCRRWRTPFSILFHNHVFADWPGIWEAYRVALGLEHATFAEVARRESHSLHRA